MIEEYRGWYSVELIVASKFERELTDLLIRQLASKNVAGGHRGHRAAAVTELARRGTGAARKALYACFDPEDDFRLAYEILEVDGSAGLQWLIHQSLHLLRWAEAWQWVQNLNDSLGEAVVAEWLDRESARDPEVAAFARLSESSPQEVDRPVVEPLSFEAFLSQAGSERPISPLLWVHFASDSELEKAWRAFESVDDAERHPFLLRTHKALSAPVRLLRMARGLSRRPQLCNVDKLTERARRWQGSNNPFAASLEEVVEPRVRRLALDLIDSGATLDGIELLAKNAVSGDEPALLAALSSLPDADVHRASITLLNMSGDLDLGPHLVWAYEQLHCTFCRHRAVSALIERDQATAELLRECLLDCSADTRQLAESRIEGG